MEKSLGTVWHKIEGFHDENISEKNFVSCGSFQLQDQFVILFRLFFWDEYKMNKNSNKMITKNAVVIFIELTMD